MVNKAVIIQRRWREVVQDLSEQHGVDSTALLQKMPAFASSEADLTRHRVDHFADFRNVTKVERKVLKSAADTMAEVIFAMVPANRASEVSADPPRPLSAKFSG